MAFRARDGRAFGNRQKMKAYDARIRTPPTQSADSLEAKGEQEPEEVETQGHEGRPEPTRPDRTPPRNWQLNPDRETSAIGKKKESNPGGEGGNPGRSGGSWSSEYARGAPGTPGPGVEDATEGQGGDISGMDINDAVAQHGPADSIEISHRGGQHTVISHHGGRTHTSSHATSHAAHLHAADAAGLAPGMGPEGAQQDMAGAGPMPIPGMQGQL